LTDAEAEPRQDATPSKPAVSLSEQLAFERLLGDLSARFADLPAEQVVDEIEHSLTHLLDFLGFDRCSFGEFTPDDGQLMVVCSVTRRGFEVLARGFIPTLPWYIDTLRAGRLFVMPNLPADLPAEAAAEAEYCARTGMRSNLSIPLRVAGQVVNVITFSAFQRTRAWPEDLIIRLKIVGEVFAQALARSRREAELTAALAEIKALKDRVEAENIYLRERSTAQLGNLLDSRSPRFNQLLEELAQVAPTMASVLLLGETGCGKEVLADAIHRLSPRRERTMVKVNCAALPPSLIEAELFGREKGAYTGALARQMGRFELASESTLFLDEIGELPVELQSKLLRAIEDGTFERVGGTRTIRVKVRIIAATNRNLMHAVAAGSLRQDLYYRLNVFPIEVPPLRERPEDIPLLTWRFVKEFAESMGKPIEHVGEDSMAALLAYPWPGNVRELRNVIERAMILTRGRTLHISLSSGMGSGMGPDKRSTADLAASEARHRVAPAAASTDPSTTTEAAQAAQATAPLGSLEAAERAHILLTLEQTGWRIRGASGAAQQLGLKPTTLESRMKRLGIHRPGSKQS
jgi:transcriptional regulator with GAF, ATPase, and Fis domain